MQRSPCASWVKLLHCRALSPCGAFALAHEGAVTYSVMSHSPGWTPSGFEIVWLWAEGAVLFLHYNSTQQYCCPNFPLLHLLLLHLPVMLVTMVLSCLTVALFSIMSPPSCDNTACSLCRLAPFTSSVHFHFLYFYTADNLFTQLLASCTGGSCQGAIESTGTLPRYKTQVNGFLTLVSQTLAGK